MADTNVYILKPIVDSPVFEGLSFAKSARSFFGNKYPHEDLEPIRQGSDWFAQSLRESWSPQSVVGGVRAFNDYPCIELSFPAFSQRAVTALGDMLTNNGELLPVSHQRGKYYVFNLLTKSNALHRSKSEIRVFPSGSVSKIECYSFYKKRLGGLSIFRLQERFIEVYVTSKFKKRVEDAALNGFNFVRVWPLPDGSNWHDEEVKARKKRSKELILRGESLVFRFRLQGAKLTKAEQNRIRRYEHELRDILEEQTSISDPYYGCVEAVEMSQGECRIFLSGPSAEELAKKLAPWIDHVDWKSEFHYVKRTGHIFDTKALEERVVVR